MAPAQSARILRRNLKNFGDDEQIEAAKIRHVRRKVSRFRAVLTIEQLDQHKIDESYAIQD